ncbi:uncharacterized protein LOC143372978 [Andrena cerasifolii]|uniref:uncharacterized protein LOC143372978 n=1 Tax=Andrena cerasifolii TaxID=2819439 RepID=UPI0040382546
MIKYVALFSAIFYLAQSQRPSYAGSGNRVYPQVLPQYIEEQAAAAGVGNRINSENDSGFVALGSVPARTSTTSTIPPDLPVDALGDVDLVNRIKTWPKEKQPFWFLNWQQIQENRGDTRHRTQSTQP